MGKGNRYKKARAEDRVNNPEKYALEKRKQEKRRRASGGLATAVACIVLVVVIVGALIFNAMNTRGVFLRWTDAMSSENFEVDAAMMNYFYNDYLMNWYSTYSNYIAYGLVKVDFSKNLKDQQYGTGYESSMFGTFDGSWYDYFLTVVKNQVTTYIEYAEGAKSEGITLTDEDRKEIDEVINNLNESLKSNNAKYSTWYGKGVKESDVRKCYELIYLASRYSDKLKEDFDKILKDNDDPVKKYPDDHKSDFYSADYLSFTITEKSSDYKNDIEFDKAIADAKARAEKIAAAKDADEFLALVKEYTESVKEEESTDADTKDTKAEESEKTVEDYKHTISYGTSSELEKWIFESDAKANDGKVIEEKKTEEVTEAGTTTESDTKATTTKKTITVYNVTAYLIINPSSLDFDLTKDLGYVITTDKAIAESILATFKADKMTSEALAEIGNKEKEKLDSESKTELYSGAVEKAHPGYFAQSYGAIDDWLESAKEGSCSDVITIEPSSKDGKTYYAICYYEKANQEVWYVSAYDGVITDMYTEWYSGSDGNGGQCAKTPVKANDRALRKLHTISFATK